MSETMHKQPLYLQLVDTLREKIENECEAGDLLPSERIISDTYGLSRTTVRLAMNELSRLGLIVRVHGKGTFVSRNSDTSQNLSSSYSFTEQMREIGREPETIILSFDRKDANKNLAHTMDLRIGDPVIEMRRLRLADNIPMMVETTYIPASRFIGLTKEALEHHSLYNIMEHIFGEKIHVAEESFCASLARLDDASLLDIPEGSAVLNLTRLTYNADNIIIEFTKSVARADQFHYKIVHSRA